VVADAARLPMFVELCDSLTSFGDGRFTPVQIHLYDLNVFAVEAGVAILFVAA
jgi:hypothetical protein